MARAAQHVALTARARREVPGCDRKREATVHSSQLQELRGGAPTVFTYERSWDIVWSLGHAEKHSCHFIAVNCFGVQIALA